MTTGIVIPDMYMPDCCWDCPLYVRPDCRQERWICYVTREEISITDATQERYAGCKLIETEIEDD